MGNTKSLNGKLLSERLSIGWSERKNMANHLGNSVKPVLQHALKLQKAGLSVIPTGGKKPIGFWKSAQTRPFSTKEIGEKFKSTRVTGIAVIAGAVSGNIECLDFDAKGEAYPAWRERINRDCPGLMKKLIVEKTPSGGYHVIFRCHGSAVKKGKVLAARENPEKAILIEIKGEKQCFTCFPTPGYKLVRGSWEDIPQLTTKERETLVQAACSLDKRQLKTAMSDLYERNPDVSRPGNDFNRRGDMRIFLLQHDWTMEGKAEDGNELWRRPGKGAGNSATIKKIDGMDVFYCFTPSTVFEQDKAYSPFKVYALLEHDGNFPFAARALRLMGYGKPPSVGIEVLDAGEWMKKKVEPSDPIICQLFDKKDKCLIVGASKARKSFFTLQLALSVAVESDFLGMEVKHARPLS